MNTCGFHLVFLVKIYENSTLCSNFNSFYNAQNLTKTYSSKSKGENYFLQKYLSAYETYLRQYGLIQQQYICANNFARGVTYRVISPYCRIIPRSCGATETLRMMGKVSNEPPIIDVYSNMFIQPYFLGRGAIGDDDLW